VQRKREQTGCVVKIGGMWCVRYADWRIEGGERIRRQNLTHKLAPVQESEVRLKRPPKYIEKLQKEFIERVNGSVENPESCSTVTQFVESTWLPFVEKKRATSTVAVYKYYWKHLLKPYIGKYLLRDITTSQLERAFNDIAREHPEWIAATFKKLRSLCSGILKRGIGLGLRTGTNPCREIETPKGLPSGETYAYTLDEIRQMLGAITDETARLIIAIAGYAGLSKSEIQGLTWEAYDPATGEIRVLSSVVNGKRGEPKTKERKKPVYLIPSVRELLDLYRLRKGNPTTGVMFASDTGKTPLDLHNLYARQIAPVLDACADCDKTKKKHRLADHEYRRQDDMVEWHGWHAFRRGLATNLNDLGHLDLTIQRILRHSDVTTTRRSYIKPREHQVTAVMSQFEGELQRRKALQESETQTAERVN
jgi:integrase